MSCENPGSVFCACKNSLNSLKKFLSQKYTAISYSFISEWDPDLFRSILLELKLTFWSTPNSLRLFKNIILLDFDNYLRQQKLIRIFFILSIYKISFFFKVLNSGRKLSSGKLVIRPDTGYPVHHLTYKDLTNLILRLR